MYIHENAYIDYILVKINIE